MLLGNSTTTKRNQPRPPNLQKNHNKIQKNHDNFEFSLLRSEVPASLSMEERDGLPLLQHRTSVVVAACAGYLTQQCSASDPNVGRLACGPDLPLFRIARKIIRLETEGGKSRNLNGIQEVPRTEDMTRSADGMDTEKEKIYMQQSIYILVRRYNTYHVV